MTRLTMLWCDQLTSGTGSRHMVSSLAWFPSSHHNIRSKRQLILTYMGCNLGVVSPTPTQFKFRDAAYMRHATTGMVVGNLLY